MKRETFYRCLVCSRAWPTQAKAVTCQSKHIPVKEEWASCELCGAGWKIGCWNPNWAVNEAKKCEDKHRSEEAKGQ